MTREAATFADLYQTHYRRVFGLCRQLLGQAERAEDAAQEAFVRAYRELSTYDSGRPFAGWILRIASNVCIDALRRRRKESQLFGAESDESAVAEGGGPGPLGELLDVERTQRIGAALGALPERYRVPLVLAYYRDASYDEIAAELGLTRTHVGTLICRAKQMLRQALAGEHEETAS